MRRRKKHQKTQFPVVKLKKNHQKTQLPVVKLKKKPSENLVSDGKTKIIHKKTSLPGVKLNLHIQFYPIWFFFLPRKLLATHHFITRIGLFILLHQNNEGKKEGKEGDSQGERVRRRDDVRKWGSLEVSLQGEIVTQVISTINIVKKREKT